MPVRVRRAPSGTWIVEEPRMQVSGRVVAYCRVSSADQQPDLDRQVACVVTEAGKRGLAVSEVVTEGSGLNGKRRTLHRVLADPHVAVVVVEHRDRLARFGVCGKIIPELLSDLDIAALRWAGIDPHDHSTWIVHRGDCAG